MQINTDKQLFNTQFCLSCGDFAKAHKNMDELVRNKKVDLNPMERKLLNDSVNYYIGENRNSILEIYPLIYKLKGKQDSKLLLLKQKQITYFEKEIDKIVKKVISLVDNYLLKKQIENEANKVFYYTLKAVNYKYLAEVKRNKEREEAIAKAKEAFEEANKIIPKINIYDEYRLKYTMDYALFLIENLGEEESAKTFLDTFIEEITKYLNEHKIDIIGDALTYLQKILDIKELLKLKYEESSIITEKEKKTLESANA